MIILTVVSSSIAISGDIYAMVRRLNPNIVTVRVLRFGKSFSWNFVPLYSKRMEGHEFL